jgi:hypothetical protein
VIAAVGLVLTGAIGSVPTASSAPRAADPVSSAFHGLSPSRILDTRPGSPTVDGLSAGHGPLAAGSVLDVQITGRAGVPATGVGAVVINLTASNATALTYITVWPSDTSRPDTSILNPDVGDTRPNAVIVGLGSGGAVSLYNYAGAVDLTADITGWFDADSFHGTGPTRVMDTRIGLGTPAGPVGPQSETGLQIGGLAGVPTIGANSVVLNVTATETSEPSFITVRASGAPNYSTSNLNTLTNRNVTGLVVVKLGPEGAVVLSNYLGTSHLVVDVMGCFGAGTITGVAPFRIMDTRDGRGGARLPLFARECVALQVTGLGSVPADGVGAVVLDVTPPNPPPRPS